jgi:hypothetical protein
MPIQKIELDHPDNSPLDEWDQVQTFVNFLAYETVNLRTPGELIAQIPVVLFYPPLCFDPNLGSMTS